MNTVTLHSKVTVVDVNMVFVCLGEGTQCRVDEEKVKKRLVVLLKYLDHKETLELQALYALQTLVHRLEYPPSKHLSWDLLDIQQFVLVVLFYCIFFLSGICCIVVTIDTWYV